MNVKIINRSKHDLPRYATEQSAGVDLRAELDTPIELKPLEHQTVATGLFIELKSGREVAWLQNMELPC